MWRLAVYYEGADCDTVNSIAVSYLCKYVYSGNEYPLEFILSAVFNAIQNYRRVPMTLYFNGYF
jgi:hypothetical protein